MQNIKNLYDFIVNNFHNYKQIVKNENSVIVQFYEEFTMQICFEHFYKIYFNNIFYYEVDEQDIMDTINDFFINDYAFCAINNKIKIIPLKKYCKSNRFLQAWSMEKVLK